MTHLNRTFRPWLRVLTLLGCVVFGLEAQEQRSNVFEEKLDVHLVQLDFLATDRAGRPVTDLTADELIVKEVGRRQEIALFERHHAPAARSLDLPDARIHFDGPDGQAPRVTDGAKPRWLVFLFDLVHNDLATRRRAEAAARELIGSDLTPGDQVAIATFDGTVHLEQNFTARRQTLERALDRAFARPAPAVDWSQRMRELIFLIRDCQKQMAAQQRFETGRECVASIGRNYVHEVRAQSERYIESFDTLGRLLAGVQGRKIVFLFSHGVSLDAGWEATDAIAAVAGNNVQIQELRYELTQEADYRPDLAAAVERAVRGDVTVFALDGSPRPTGDFDVDERVRLRNTASPYTTAFDEARRGLAELAQSTGGRFYGSGNFAADLDRALEATRGAYTVGYYRDLSRVKKLDAFFKVKIDCKRKGVEITTRPGYYLTPVSRAARLGRLELGVRSSLRTTPGSDGLGQKAKPEAWVSGALAEKESRPEGALVPFSITANPLSFDLVEMEREVGIHFTLHLELRTREGETLADSFHFLGHSFPREVWEKGTVVAPRYAGYLSLPPGEYRFSAVLRDPRSDVYAELEQSVSVPAESHVSQASGEGDGVAEIGLE